MLLKIKNQKKIFANPAKPASNNQLIVPFVGLRLKDELIREGETLCLPYDCLTPELESKLRKFTFNAIHLEEPKPSVVEGRKLWSRWKEKGALLRDAPTYYLLIEEFGGIQRAGFLGMIDLVEAKKSKTVWPHEKTYRRFINQRKTHLKRTRLNLSPIFLVAEDKTASLARLLTELAGNGAMPRFSFGRSVFDGVDRSVAVLSQHDWVNSARRALMPQNGFLVADGHHRFQAATELAEEGILRYSLCYVTSSKAGTGLLKKHPPIAGRRGNAVEPPSLGEIIAKAQKGELFPRKTTYFWPKIPCGLVYGEL